MTTAQVFTSTLPIPRSKSYSVVDIGHWHAHPVDRRLTSTDYHVSLFTDGSESISGLAAEIVGFLTRAFLNIHIRYGKDRFHKQWNNTIRPRRCPLSSGSSSNDVLKLLDMCRQACWDKSGSELIIDDLNTNTNA